jgi:hypothetical protein
MPKYTATVKNVRELCLVGTADCAFWQAYLAPQELSPTNFNGHARIVISAAKLKWMGITFNELSISLPIDPPDSTAHSIYLVSAFNSSRMFAWCEQNIFQTPYQHAAVAVEPEQPWSIELRDNTRPTLVVRCPTTTPTTTMEDTRRSQSTCRPPVTAQSANTSTPN